MKGPSRTPSYFRMTPRRAATSFENLVALANDQEQLREARKIIWRDRGDPVVHLDSLADVAEHALRGGLRAAGLGFGIRAGFNLFLLLFRALRSPRAVRFALIRHAVLGLDSFRFAAMLGSFAALYKFLLNALPILHPSHVPDRSISFIMKTISPTEPPTPLIHIESGYPEEIVEKRSSQLTVRAQFVRKKTKRWHAALAGFISAGVAVSFEAKARRLVIAQQLFVRGLQGSYNGVSRKHGLSVPNGAVWLFAMCCGQIMYAFFLRPDTIPRSYVTWIQTASRATTPTVSINRDLVRNGNFNFSDMRYLINWERTTTNNKTVLMDRLALAESTGDFGPRFPPCAAVHPWFDHCRDVQPDRFLSVMQWMAPIYGALHFIPMLLFRSKAVMKDPWKMLYKAAFGTMRSSAFLGVFVMIYQTYFCLKHNSYDFLTTPKAKIPIWISQLLISKYSLWFGGFLAGLSLFVEEQRRRGELAMYVLPKGLESLYKILRGKGLLPGSQATQRSGYGESLLAAVGMAMVMSTYQLEPQHLSGLVRRILYQFVGPN